jgi:hypothetical protein
MSVARSTDVNFNYWDLGEQQAGAIVQVTLSGNAANVRLFDSSNYGAFKAGRGATGYGGHATPRGRRFDFRCRVAATGMPLWTTEASPVMAGQASRCYPALRERSMPSLDSLAESVAAINHAEDELVPKEWDVFISHAHEDKDEIVRPLAHALQELGLRVWFDELELRIGDSLRRKIDQGIARSAFGVVVLSTAFFAKNWAQYELDGLVTRSVDGSQVLLPLWHKLTKAEVMAQSPSLADKLARSTTDSTLEEIAAEIAEVVATATQAVA